MFSATEPRPQPSAIDIALAEARRQQDIATERRKQEAQQAFLRAAVVVCDAGKLQPADAEKLLDAMKVLGKNDDDFTQAVHLRRRMRDLATAAGEYEERRLRYVKATDAYCASLDKIDAPVREARLRLMRSASFHADFCKLRKEYDDARELREKQSSDLWTLGEDHKATRAAQAEAFYRWEDAHRAAERFAELAKANPQLAAGLSVKTTA